MKIGISILFLWISYDGRTQNLVLNADFEDFETCYDKFTVNFQKTIIPYWESPSQGTPYYYKTCSDDMAGKCDAVSGHGYAGIYLWKKVALGNI